MPPGVYPHKRGRDSHLWRGGRVWNGVRFEVAVPGRHPRKNSWGYVPEHVLVAEKALGRFLPQGAIVHHLDHNRANNHSSNLVICQDAAYHGLLHQREKALKAVGNPDARKCSICLQWEINLGLGLLKRKEGSFRHRACHALYEKQRRRR